MILGIDASNIRAGGGVTHLVELLRAADPEAHGFEQVVAWGGSATLAKLETRDWLHKVHDPLLDRALPYRVFWQRSRLKKLALQAGCDLLFVPGGSDASGFKPMVTMNRNLLPFEWSEVRRYGFSLTSLKLLLLRFNQSRTLRKADGVIFLTQYAHDAVLKVSGDLPGRVGIVPHGINHRFFLSPRQQRQPHEFSNEQPCRLLYVSIVTVYKHQWNVAESVAQMHSKGVPIVLDLVGPPGPGMSRLSDTLQRIDPEGAFITYRGAVPYEKLHELYAVTDIGVFASSCEAFGQILTEAMSAGLPIACSNRSVMPELLGEAGVYFDPEKPDEIAAAIRQLFESPELRAKKAQAAYQKAQAFSWDRCAEDTFEFLAQIAAEHRPKTASSEASL